MKLRRSLPKRRLIVLPVAVFAALALLTGTAMAEHTRVMIVTQGEFPAPAPGTAYFHTIQAAVNATKPNDYVLIEPGVYDEPVKVTKPHSHIWIRGMNRNTVIVDGQHKGGNGIEIYKDNDVWVENLTVRNFELTESCGDESCGNEIWWNGGSGSGKIGAHGWFGRYLTAYDTGMNGGYGIFTNDEKEGSWENIYSSGMDDSGIYLGACRECEARIDNATMEDNAVGYSGSNSGGNLIIENSTFRDNRAGIVPNSENPGDPPPPSNGACDPKHPYEGPHPHLPKFTTTDIAHCTIYRDNLVEDNNNLSAPTNGSTGRAPWGVGVEFPGVYGDAVEDNTIKGNVNDGFLGFEYPNPFPQQEDTIVFALSGVRVANNTFEDNGSNGGPYAKDIFMQGGFFISSPDDCAIGNTTPDGTEPADLEGTWSCNNATTPSPNDSFGAVEWVIQLSEESEAYEGEAQPAPEAQETMPHPCEGVPANPLCE
ncbi:MAG TPA: hypothetical protein VMA83_02770 [Solirubrobacteraceae bacterium]|nr:hypothetical protein [Solirubrobacteraceae bacterium]